MPGVNTQVVSYNGLVLPLCQIGFKAHAEYDSTGMNVRGYRYTFSGHFWVVSADGTVPSLTQQLAIVEAAMSQVGKTFTWTSAGTVIFNITSGNNSGYSAAGAGAYQDRDFGPKPRIVSTRQITGGLSARVDFEIECFLFTCFSLLSAVEEFWWKFDYSFDRNYICTRNVSGRYKCRSGINTAQQFLPNGALFPPVPLYFFRDNFRTSLSTDGTTLDFSFSDKQVWRTLPRPLTNGSSTMRVTTGIAGQMKKHLSGFFEAPTDVDKKVIIQFIIAMINAHFPAALAGSGGQQTITEYFTSFEFTDNCFENRVDFSVSSQTTTPDFRFGGANNTTTQSIIAALFKDVTAIAPAAGDSWTQIDGGSSTRSMLGTAGLMPVPASQFNQCSVFTNSPPAGVSEPSPSGDINSRAPGMIESPNAAASAQGNNLVSPAPSAFSGSSGTPQANPNASTWNLQYPYTAFTETYHYVLDHNLKQMPVPVPAQNGNPAPDDVIQQTANPVLRIFQIGTAVRFNKPPDRPRPLYTDNAVPQSGPTAYVAKQSFTIKEPVMMPDGRNIQYKASWAYEIVNARARIISCQDVGANGTSQGVPAARVGVPVNPMLDPAYYPGGNPDGSFDAPIFVESVVQNAYGSQDPVSSDGSYSNTTWDQTYYPGGFT